MIFRIGQKVVCVNDKNSNLYGKQELVAGAIYTVRWVGEYYHPRHGIKPSVRVAGIVRDATDQGFPEHSDVPFGAHRFRPLDERKTDISIFQRMLDDCTLTTS